MNKLILCGAIFLLGAYAAAAPPPAREAEAKIEAKSASRVKGTVIFEPTPDGMKVSYNLEGLQPSSKHGFHVHEKGDCSSPDAKSAGPHFAKIKTGGGTSRDNPDEYAGDFPEVQANEKGKASGDFLMPRLKFDGPYSILNRAIVVHASADDPMKKSAARVACGVVHESSVSAGTAE